MGFISRLKEKFGAKRGKKNSKLDRLKPVDHRALCLRSTMYMIFIAAIVMIVGPRFASRYMGIGDPLKRASNYYQQGNSFYESGNLRDAEKSFRDAVELNPNHVFAFSNLVHSKLFVFLWRNLDISRRLFPLSLFSFSREAF